MYEEPSRERERHGEWGEDQQRRLREMMMAAGDAHSHESTRMGAARARHCRRESAGVSKGHKRARFESAARVLGLLSLRSSTFSAMPMGLRRALVLALPLLATSLHVQAHVRPALRAAPAVTLSVPRVAAPCRMATNVTVSSTEPVQRLPPPSLSKIAMRVSVPVTIAMCIFYFFGSSLVRGAMGVYHACELTTSKHDPSFLHSPCD